MFAFDPKRIFMLPDERLIREEAELISSIYCMRRDLRHQVADHVLLRMQNVIVTPHSAFNAREAIACIMHTAVEIIGADRFRNGPRSKTVAPGQTDRPGDTLGI